MSRRAILILALGATACGPSEQITSSTPAEQPLAPEGPPVPGIAPSEPTDLTWIPVGYGPDEPQVVVFIGDSISKGFGASDDALAYDTLLWSNDDLTYPTWVGRDLLTEFDSIERGVDVAFAGATTQGVLDASIPALDTWIDKTWSGGSPGEAVVFLTIGGNDLQEALLPDSDPTAIADATRHRLLAIVEALLDPNRFPAGVTLYATNVYEPSGGVGQSTCFWGYEYQRVLPDLDEYNLQVRELAQEYGFAAVDLYSPFLAHGPNGEDPDSTHYDAEDPSNWFAQDCIHPNDRGHHELRKLMWQALQGPSGQPLE